MFERLRSLSKVQKIGLFLLVLIVCMVLFEVISREPYDVAMKYLSENRILNERIGKLENIRRSIFGTTVRFTGPTGTANLKLLVTGEKGEGEVYVDLEKKAGVWSVIRANLMTRNENIILNVP